MRLLLTRDGRLEPGEIDAAQLSDLYLHPLPHGGRPVRLRTNFVTSLDGSIQGPDGRSGSINTPSDQYVFALHRAHADAVLVGAQTVRAEHYKAVDLAPWQRETRRQHGLAPFPVLVVLSGSLNLDPAISANGNAEVGTVMVFTTAGKSPDAVAPFEAAGVEVVQLDGGSVDLTAVTGHLAAKGYRRVLCEGGSRLHRDLLAADLVDELSLTLAPVVVGGPGSRTTVGEPILGTPGFRLDSALLGDDGALFLHYVRNPT